MPRWLFNVAHYRRITFHLMAVSQVNLGQLFFLGFFLHLFQNWTFEEKVVQVIVAGCPSCHSTSSVKAPEETQKVLTTTSGLTSSFLHVPLDCSD